MSGAVFTPVGSAFCDEKYAARSRMSALLMPAAIGDISSFLRLPSRNWNSEVTMNCAGCAAIDGNAGVVELPFGPWQATQAAALARPSSTPAAAGPAASAETAARAARRRPRPPARRCGSGPAHLP